MTRKIIFYFLLVFLSGSVVGALAYRTYNPPTARGSAQSSPNEWRRGYIEETRSRLSLTDEQVDKLKAMLDQTEERFREARKRENQEIRQIGEEHYQRVRTILTPEQLPKYEKLHEEREAKAKEQERNNKR
jgi:Spy/CpxP family protein refolding chaperone